MLLVPSSPGAGTFAVPEHVPIALRPPSLEYEPWPLCVPSVATVELINTSEDEDVEVEDVSVSQS